MYQFFIEEHQLTGDKIAILGSDVNHIKNVLRMKGGERVRVSLSDSGRSFFCVLDSISDDEELQEVMNELSKSELLTTTASKNGEDVNQSIQQFRELCKKRKELVQQLGEEAARSAVREKIVI